MIKHAKFINQTFLSEDQLTENSVKTRTLSIIIDRIKIAESKLTQNSPLYAPLETLRGLVEDAYIISMYKFEFKIFTLSLLKELKTIEDIINA
jgi:hypothetical protein